MNESWQGKTGKNVFDIGSIHEANDGPYEVISKVNWMTRRIRFLGTGYEVDANFPSMLVGEIKRPSEPRL